MSPALLGAVVLLVTSAAAYTYRTPDGIDHYVGNEQDIPPAYRRASHKIVLTGVPLNSDLAKNWHQGEGLPAGAKGKATDITLDAPRAPAPKEQPNAAGGMSGPTAVAIVAAILLLLFPMLLLSWIRAPERRRTLVFAIVDLAIGLGLGFYATVNRRQLDPGEIADLNPVHAIENAQKARDQVKATEAAQEKQTQEILGEPVSPAKPR
jgi:hypothetical protein